jgi:hypothetical protein
MAACQRAKKPRNGEKGFSSATFLPYFNYGYLNYSVIMHTFCENISETKCHIRSCGIYQNSSAGRAAPGRGDNVAQALPANANGGV